MGRGISLPRPSPGAPMIGIRSNAEDVGAVLRQIAKDFPKESRAALSTVGMWARKRVQDSVRGKGPVPIRPLHPATLVFRRAVGDSKRTPGGRLPQAIRYKRSGKRVLVGTTDSGQRAFERYQSAERRDYGADARAKVYRKLTKRGASRDQIEAIRESQALNPYNRPARPIIEPFAKMPALASEIRRVAVGRVNQILKAAAARAAQGVLK